MAALRSRLFRSFGLLCWRGTSDTTISTVSSQIRKHSMEGKVGIVTGASSGIGEAIALMLASRGASLSLGGRDKTRLKESMNKCVQANGGHSERFLDVQGDVNEQNLREDIVKRTINKFKRLDVLIASSGTVLFHDSLPDMTEDDYNDIMDTKVKSVFFLIKAAAKHLEKSRGNVIIISSIVSERAIIPPIVYPMSQAALDHMTRCLALNLGPRGIRVNSVNPSFAPSRLIRDIENLDSLMEAAVKRELGKQPLGNRLVQLNEIAEVAAFLASDSASFVTGQNLKVDGGRCLHGPFVRPS